MTDRASDRVVADKEEREAALLWLSRSFAQKRLHYHANPYHNLLFSLKPDHSAGCNCQSGTGIRSFCLWIAEWGSDNVMRDYLLTDFGVDIDTEPLRHYEFTKPEGQRPLHEPSYIANGEPVLLSLGHYPDRLDEGVYHSWSCLCDDCLREDYALCQYYPGGALTMESWRKMYYKGRY
jgi:hypothetical protein